MAVAASASASGICHIPCSVSSLRGSSDQEGLANFCRSAKLRPDDRSCRGRRRAMEMECLVTCGWENPRSSSDWWNPLFDTQDWSSFKFGYGDDGTVEKGEDDEEEDDEKRKDGGNGCGRLRETERDAEDREI